MQINSLPSADKEGSLKQVFATFVLKPVEIQCPDNIYYFLDVEKFLMFQVTSFFLCNITIINNFLGAFFIFPGVITPNSGVCTPFAGSGQLGEAIGLGELMG